MPSPQSYLVCGTPRTGSTFLCSLLSSTGVAGYPEAYFRQPDQRAWADRLGVPIRANGSFDYRAFVDGAVRAGSTPNGVFAARVMWGTMRLLVQGLSPVGAARKDLEVLVQALGLLRFVHLRRDDVVAQAVSWARAEQTGCWQQTDVPTAEPRFDIDQVEGLVRTIHEHNAAWTAWFAGQNAEPLTVTYEDVIAQPQTAVEDVLRDMGVQPPAGWQPASPCTKQADEMNTDWVRKYQTSDGQPSGPLTARPARGDP